MDARCFAETLLKTVDEMNVERFISFLSEKAEFRFGSAAAVCGKIEVAGAVGGFFSGIKGLRHHLVEVWEFADSIICQGDVAYTRLDESQVTIPFMNYWQMDGELIRRYLIYMDLSPLFAAE